MHIDSLPHPYILQAASHKNRDFANSYFVESSSIYEIKRKPPGDVVVNGKNCNSKYSLQLSDHMSLSSITFFYYNNIFIVIIQFLCYQRRFISPSREDRLKAIFLYLSSFCILSDPVVQCQRDIVRKHTETVDHLAGDRTDSFPPVF